MADATLSDLKHRLLPVQEALALAGFQLRQARNKAESVALMPDSTAGMSKDVDAEVNALGAVIRRVDAISGHLRKMTAEPKAEEPKKGAGK